MNSSFLSQNPPYGYDVVVGVAQAALNATLKRYLRDLEAPLVEICYILNEDDEYEEIPLAKLMAESDNVNPFDVPDGTKLSDRKVKSLDAAGFRCAMRVQLGIPEGYNPSGGFTVIRIQGGIHQVEWDLLCATFHLVAIDFERRKYVNGEQNPDDPWIFKTKLDLRLWKTDESRYNSLPPDVQEQIEVFKSAKRLFDVETLLFDLNKTFLSAKPTIKPVGNLPHFEALITKFFEKQYMQDIRKKGDPLLGVVIVPDDQSDPGQHDSTLDISEVRYWVNPYMNAQGSPKYEPSYFERESVTFNYLCATNKNHLPSPYTMTWNWMSPDRLKDYHGVLAINRSTFVAWFVEKLEKKVFHANSIMIPPSIKNGHFTNRFFDNQVGTLETPGSGSEVIKYQWNWGYDEKKSDTLYYNSESEYTASVKFTGDTIVIKQNQRWYVSAKDGIGSGNSDFANVVDIYTTDTWTMDVDASGKLVFKFETKTEDKSWPFTFPKIADLSKTIVSTKAKVTKNITSITPPNMMQEFFFPGGHTFSFKEPVFSNNQDLLLKITYKDPEAVMQFIPDPDYKPFVREKKIKVSDLKRYEGTGNMGTRFRDWDVVPSTI